VGGARRSDSGAVAGGPRSKRVLTMANIRIAWTNLWSAASSVLVASSAASGLPGSASQNPDRSYVWRSATATGVQTLDIDLGAATAITCVMIANPKLIGSGVIELHERGSAGSAGAANLVATLPAADSDTRVTFAFFSSNSKRHW